MTRSLHILITIILSLKLSGQVTCEVSNLTKADKELIQQFWTKLKTAVNKRDKNSLLRLCSLPLDCSYCSDDNSSNEEGVQVTKKSFLDQHYKIFFEPEFKKLLKKDSLHVTTHYGKQDKCSYLFGYTFI